MLKKTKLGKIKKTKWCIACGNKQNQVDIKVEDSNGQLVLIEVRFIAKEAREQDYLFRILFSTAKCLTAHMDICTRYSGVSKVISISILYFDFRS